MQRHLLSLTQLYKWRVVANILGASLFARVTVDIAASRTCFGLSRDLKKLLMFSEYLLARGALVSLSVQSLQELARDEFNLMATGR